jgi:hypothetical protein
MYSESEIESAVASGKLSQEAADALRSHASSLRDTPNADEEQIRLVTSFNDIFVAIAGVLVLVATGYLAGSVMPALGGFAVAAVAWGLAEFFTRVRHMAFPSIVFFIAFYYGIFLGMLAIFAFGGGFSIDKLAAPNESPLGAILTSAVPLLATWLHWKRFMVPISIAAMVASAVTLAASVVTSTGFFGANAVLMLYLILGLGVFAFAMWWDISDRERKTRRSDVAFWLHLLASPMIVHSIFMLLGFNFFGTDGVEGVNAALLAIVAIILYLLFGVLALIVDRRAFLVSALVYVLAAVVYLLTEGSAGGAGFAMAAILIGSGLLLLSALWQKARAKLVSRLPDHWQARLPILYRENAATA